jgi:ferredoxin
MARVIIDGNKCQGHGRCMLVAPEIFDLDDAGLAYALMETVPPELRPGAEEAVFTCPENAISLEE